MTGANVTVRNSSGTIVGTTTLGLGSGDGRPAHTPSLRSSFPVARSSPSKCPTAGRSPWTGSAPVGSPHPGVVAMPLPPTGCDVAAQLPAQLLGQGSPIRVKSSRPQELTVPEVSLLEVRRVPSGCNGCHHRTTVPFGIQCHSWNFTRAPPQGHSRWNVHQRRQAGRSATGPSAFPMNPKRMPPLAPPPMAIK